MSRTSAIAVLVMAGLLGRAAEARAEVTAALLVSGGGARAERVRSAAAGELARAGWKVPELVGEAAEALRSCLRAEPAWPCLEPRLVERGLTRVVAIQLAAEAGDRGAADLQLIGQLGSVDSRRLAAQSRYCRRCDDAQLSEAARLLVRRLVAANAVRDDVTRIEVRTTPPGAVLRLDGRLVEAPDGAIACSPGLHTVHVQRSGYRSELRAVLVEEGRAASLEITMLPASAGAAPRGLASSTVERIALVGEGEGNGDGAGAGRGDGEPSAVALPAPTLPSRRAGAAAAQDLPPKPRRSSAAPGRTSAASRSQLAWPLALSGAALLASGVALVWLDEDAADDAAVVHSPRYLDSAPAGAAVLAAGGVAALAGAYLLLTPASPAYPASARSARAPSLALSIGIGGAF